MTHLPETSFIPQQRHAGITAHHRSLSQLLKHGLVDLQLGPDYMGCVGVLSHRTPLARLIEGDELLAAAAVPLRTTTG